MENSIKFPLVRQRDKSDCGIACLASIVKYYGGAANLENLRRLCGTSREGTTMLGLYQGAKEVGFDAVGLEVNSHFDLLEIKEPVILHVHINENVQHFIIFLPQYLNGNKGSKDDHIYFADPSTGIKSISMSELNTVWKSKALLKLSPNDRFLKIDSLRNQKQKWVKDLIKEDFNLLLISIFLGVVIAILGISTAIFSQRLIDDLLPAKNWEMIIIGVIVVVLLLLIRTSLGFFRGTLMLRQGMNFNNRIINSFYSSLLNLSKSFFDTHKTGEIISRMNDTRRIQSVLVLLSGSIFIDFLLIITATVFVFTYSMVIGLILLLSMPIHFFIFRHFNTPLIRAQKNVMASSALTQSNFVDTLQGITEIKLMNKQSFFEKINSILYGTTQKNIVVLGTLNIKFSVAAETINILTNALIIGVASFLVIKNQIQLGEMVALLAMASTILPSIIRVMLANIDFQEAKVAFNRMFEFTFIEKEISSDQIMTQPTNLSIEIRGLFFGFPGRRAILKNVNIQMKTGEISALLGESGNGKSTLLQILQKFYQPQEGLILVNGVDLSSINNESWRSYVGNVAQEIKIFNGHLLFNITLNDDLQEYNNAIVFCDKIGLGKYFRSLPQGYYTQIGEEGVNVSGGQKQLIGLARALFRKPKVLFLDEATSSMDSAMENFVLETLSERKSEMAILMVTHREHIAKFCDKVYQLENSQIQLREKY